MNITDYNKYLKSKKINSKFLYTYSKSISDNYIDDNLLFNNDKSLTNWFHSGPIGHTFML